MLRVIQVLHHSLGQTAVNAEPESGLAGWHELVAREIAKRTDEIAIECWRPESTAKRIHVWRDEYGVTHKLFPSNRLRYGVEISVPLIRCLGEIRRDSRTLLHLHGLYNVGTYLTGFLFGKRLPIVAQSHDPLEFTSRGFRAIQTNLRRVALSKIDTFFLSTETEQTYFSDIFGAGKCRLEPLAVDLELFRQMNRRRARLNLGWRQDQYYALYVGRLIESKGLRYLIQASRMLASQLPDLHVVIVGFGGLKSPLPGTADLPDNVTLLGQMRYRDLPMCYSAADVFVLPSLREAWGRVIVESLACQTPVIATRTGCVPTLAKEGLDGIFIVPMRDHVALANKIAEVLPRAAAIRRAIVRNRLERYGWDNVVRDMIRVYNKLIGQ